MDQVRLPEEVTSGLNESWSYMGKEKKIWEHSQKSLLSQKVTTEQSFKNE